ncbi:MAG: methyltransferase domain-containing protein [Myxococcaceae bacterium]
MSAQPAAQKYVHGSTDDFEVARLEKQAEFICPLTFSRLDLKPGHRVLDLATGTGAMATRLLRDFPGVHLAGVDLSPTQLAAARKNHPEVHVARADATRLPFADHTFDRVHCSWLLEHVRDPLPILREVRRVLRPEGFCVFIEVENDTFSMSPPSQSVSRVLAMLNAAQRDGGGDPNVGRHVARFFQEAGFPRVQVDRPLLRGADENAAYRQQFIDEFSEIFEGLDESLGAAHAADIAQAVADLRSLPARHGSLQYTPAIVRAWSRA